MKIALPIWSSKGGTQYVINKAYIKYIEEAGYEPVIVTIHNSISLIADECDGLLLPGGIDLDPIFYDEDNLASIHSDPEKDDFERSILHAFIDVNKPIFGICRGFQLVIREYFRIPANRKKYSNNFQYYQHIPDHSLVSELEVSRTQPTHSVYALRNHLYGETNNKTVKMYVNSMHHQALCLYRNKSDPTLTFGDIIVCALTRYGLKDKDPAVIVEALKINNWSTGGVIGVQWHPEELQDYALLHTLFGTDTTTEEGGDETQTED